jgi:hypothetical protein
MDPSNVAAVVTAAFLAKDTSGLEIALREVGKLGLRTVVVVYDVKSATAGVVVDLISTAAEEFARCGTPLLPLPVDEDDTGFRWRRGITAAFAIESIAALLVFPGDFAEEPSDKAREGWRRMVQRASPDTLVPGDFQASRESFKDRFDGLVGYPSLDQLFPEAAAELRRLGLQRLRTEFFVVGRVVWTKFCGEGWVWPFDPTVCLALSAIRNGFRIEVEPIEFADEAIYRNPTGQLFQMERFVFYLALNALRVRPVARGADPLRQYDDESARLNRLLRLLEHAVRTNRLGLSSNERPKRPDRDTWRRDLLASTGDTDLIRNDDRLPGRGKYDPQSFRPLPFVGLSLVQMLTDAASAELGLPETMEGVRRTLRDAGFESRFAFVTLSSLHVTIFDLINEPEHSGALSDGGFDYAEVRIGVERATQDWLTATGLRLGTSGTITGLATFPGVLKLDVDLAPAEQELFETFRLALHRHLESVPGYSRIRVADWRPTWTPHITVAYQVHPVEEHEIDRLTATIAQINAAFVARRFEVNQGEVTRFDDMDTFYPA